MAERRELGLAAAIAAVTGQSIALGIFLTPATMAKSLGSPLLLGAVWCAMAVVTVCGALCYSELAVRFPEAGGEYVYLRQGYGVARRGFHLRTVAGKLTAWERTPRPSRYGNDRTSAPSPSG